jgi:hypothetical protein
MSDMPIDRRHIGYRAAPFTVTVTADGIAKFAAAIGVAAPLDPTVDQAAPPTYMKVIEGANGSSRALVEALGIGLHRVMHTEQEFEYFRAIRANDEITVERNIADIAQHKDRIREVVIVDTTLRHRDGAEAGRSRQWILVRNEPPPTGQ